MNEDNSKMLWQIEMVNGRGLLSLSKHLAGSDNTESVLKAEQCKDTVFMISKKKFKFVISQPPLPLCLSPP